MTHKTWLATAKGLAVGRKTRIMCCASSPSMLVSHTDKAFTAHCFKCGLHLVEEHGDLSLSRMEEYERAKEFKAAPPKVPKDIKYEPNIWFLKAGISTYIAKEYGIGYSEWYNRVVLPVTDLDTGELLTVQLRACNYPAQQPKYINPANAPRTAIFESRDDLMLPSATPKEGVAVLTEDILSAIKVGRLQKAFSSMGTSISADGLIKLTKYHTVYLWYDNDEGGEKGRKKVAHDLQFMGIKVKHIVTDKDPKLLTYDEIKEVLC